MYIHTGSGIGSGQALRTQPSDTKFIALQREFFEQASWQSSRLVGPCPMFEH